MIISCSKDSTLKLWNCGNGKMIRELPGHSDEIYALDWSEDGEKVASGGRDAVLKIWSF